MKAPGPTETRVRAALLRRWRREPESTQEREWDSDLVCGWVMLDGEGGVRWNVYEAIQRAGRNVAKGKGFNAVGTTGWSELDDGVEYTYERGVFRVRKRSTAGSQPKRDFVDDWSKAIADTPIGTTRHEPRVTQRQLDVMRHATGGKLRDHRNYYCAEPGTKDHAAWTELVAMGLAGDGEPPGSGEAGARAGRVFHVTEAGFRMAYGDVRKKAGKRGER